MVSIFVGAVLLPSVALSVFSFDAIPKHAENFKNHLKKEAAKTLFYVESDLEMMARTRALTAARSIGPDTLLEGHGAAVRQALVAKGIPEGVFEMIRLEGSSPVVPPPCPPPGSWPRSTPTETGSR